MHDTREILKKVRQVEIRTNRVVTEALAGAYHSVFRGQGLNFEEVREYTPGDDVRAIDWNVTARMDRPFVKVFREERELSIMLLVDLSASSVFGSLEQSKRERAAEFASVLAFSAVRNNDKVGLLLFTGGTEALILPRKGRRHILRVIRELLFFEPRGRGTDLGHALETLNRVVPRRCVAFLMSDFLGSAGAQPGGNGAGPGNAGGPALPEGARRTLAVTARRHDLTCVLIEDPRERELVEAGILTLEDAESGAQVEVDTRDARLRERYRARNTARVEGLRREVRRAGAGFLRVSTAEDYLKPLRVYFERRRGGA